MKKVVIAGLLGGLVYFIFGALSWMVLPWHNATVKTLAREESQKLELMRIGKRHEELEAQIATGKALRDRVDKELEDGDWTPAQLKMLADTAKAASDISVRAVGVGDSGLTSREFANKEAEEKKAAGKMPLVVLIQGGGLPHVRPATVDYENAQPL